MMILPGWPLENESTKAPGSLFRISAFSHAQSGFAQPDSRKSTREVAVIRNRYVPCASAVDSPTAVRASLSILMTEEGRNPFGSDPHWVVP